MATRLLAILGLVGVLAVSCDAPKPDKSDLIGVWSIGNAQDQATAAKIDLRSDGTATIQNWPDYWLDTDDKQLHVAHGRWAYMKLGDDVVVDLYLEHVDSGLESKQMPLFWGNFFGRPYLEIGVFGSDGDFPTFYKGK